VLYGSTDVIVNVIYCDGMNLKKNIEIRNEWSYAYTPHTHTHTKLHGVVRESFAFSSVPVE